MIQKAIHFWQHSYILRPILRGSGASYPPLEQYAPVALCIEIDPFTFKLLALIKTENKCEALSLFLRDLAVTRRTDFEAKGNFLKTQNQSDLRLRN